MSLAEQAWRDHEHDHEHDHDHHQYDHGNEHHRGGTVDDVHGHHMNVGMRNGDTHDVVVRHMRFRRGKTEAAAEHAREAVQADASSALAHYTLALTAVARPLYNYTRTWPVTT